MYHGPVDDNFWHGAAQPGNRRNGGAILFGIIGEENPNHPGTYRFSSTCGIVINDAHVLSQDADVNGAGEYNKPRPGSMCVCAMPRDGAPAFIWGFQDPPKWNEDPDTGGAESDEPEVGNQSDIATSGDKVYQTVGGAKLMLRRGGLTIIEGGPGTSVLLSPVNNQMTLRSSNFSHIVNGYKARRGRKEPGKTDPATQHEEEFWSQVGGSYDAVKLRHGTLGENARRELTITEVVVAGGQTATVTKTRETYDSDGKWVGEGPEYTWGDVDSREPFVLGDTLVSVLKELIIAIRSLTVPTAWGPSGTPINAASFVQVQNKLESILSEFLYASKSPADLG